MAECYYGSYLQLDRILSSQTLQSEKQGHRVHDEMLFIITHQVYELWFKQILHEIDSVIRYMSNEELEDSAIGIVVSRLMRVVEIQRLLLDQIAVLETMTPMDFLEFRSFLTPASGFQSFQFRLIENKLGLRSRTEYAQTPYLNRLNEEHRKRVEMSEKEPTLFECVDTWLARTPFLQAGDFNFWSQYKSAVMRMIQEEKSKCDLQELPAEEKERQKQRIDRMFRNFEAIFDSEIYEERRKKKEFRLSFGATQAALLIFLYREQPVFHLPYKLLSLLVDIDEGFTTWRSRHALMVHRMIGDKAGTGGSSGFQYLRVTAEMHKVFTEISNLSTFLIPRSARPELPDSILRRMGFHYKS